MHKKICFTVEVKTLYGITRSEFSSFDDAINYYDKVFKGEKSLKMNDGRMLLRG